MAGTSIKRSALLLGFALGGFFDGIMLHQVLQWHHLLSLVPGSGELRAQILWDGLFHILMYLLAVIGLAGLWRAGREQIERRQLTIWLLLGFGVWQIVDVVFFHWILGIHRIRVDQPDPLLWDVGWLIAVGGPPFLIAALLGRKPQPPASLGDGLPLLLLALTIGTAGAGAWALQGPPDQRFTTVVFQAGMDEPQMMGALAASGAQVAGANPSEGVYVVALGPGRGWELYRRGALFVAGNGAPAGCSAWSVA
jgi:uncharacterized membrane protein